jgi:hypothetical protein
VGVHGVRDHLCGGRLVSRRHRPCGAIQEHAM